MSGVQGAQFSTDLLSSLMGLQSSGAPSASDESASLIKTADANGDGQLSADEISQALSQGGAAPDVTQAFASLDANGDGQLSQTELAAGLSKLQQDSGAGQVHHGHHHHHHGGGGGASASALSSQLVSDLDTDGDGSLSADEVTSALGASAGASGGLAQAFASLDANSNGQLSTQEITDAFQRLLTPNAQQAQTA
jgi:Ca2+-binding EF-hand superfamily protein